MIDPLCPSGELPRVVAQDEFQCIERTVGHISQGEEIEVVQPLQDLAQTRSMKSWQQSHGKRGHEDALGPMPDFA